MARTAATVGHKKNHQKTKIVNNPFEIKDDITYSGRGVDDYLVTALLEKVMELEPGDIRHSVCITTTHAPTKKDASNLFLNLKRVMANHPDKQYHKIVLVSKAVHEEIPPNSGTKVYAGTRIFRKV